jgi:CRISPR/Cas system CSM-associated protein Csm3 (group 7 of RAMP superfamily)
MTETRTGVAIDRILGSVAHGPFDFEVVTRGAFATTIQLRNFEVWQLGLLALVLRDLEEGLIPIGFGKSRGLGDVEAKVNLFKVRYPSVVDEVRSNAVHTLYGIGKLATDEERRAYWTLDEKPERDFVNLQSEGHRSDDGMGLSVTFEDAARQELFRTCVDGRWREVVHHDRGQR